MKELQGSGSSERKYSIDILKFIFSILIVSLHIGFGDLILPITFLARIGVPFFFAASALFVFSGENITQHFGRSVKHMLRLFGVWLAVYSPILFMYYADIGEKGVVFDALSCIQNILFKCPAYLWYLLASVVGLCLTFMLRKHPKVALLLACALYVLGTLGNTYLSAFGDEGSIWYYKIFLTTHNGVFFAFPVMQVTVSLCLGKLKCFFEKKLVFIGIILVFIAEFVVANLNWNTSSDKSMYFALPLVAATICALAFRYHGPDKNSRVLAEMSTGIYLTQFGFITCLSILLPTGSFLVNLLIWTLCVLLGILATLFIRLFKKTKRIFL